MPLPRTMPMPHRFCAVVLSLLAGLAALAPRMADAAAMPEQSAGTKCVKADIVALEQAYILNRFSAFVPAGMLYALKADVVAMDARGNADPAAELQAGKVRLRDGKRPRPIVLRVNEGECLQVTFTNLLSPQWSEEGGIPLENGGRMPSHVEEPANTVSQNVVRRIEKVSVDRPRTRAASFHITGLELIPMTPEECPAGALCGGDGSNVGLAGQQGVVFSAATPDSVRQSFNQGSLAMPGQTVITRWRAVHEGSYFAYSMGAPVGGEGDGGQIGLGLFGAVQVEPKDSQWYRSQVTHQEIGAVASPVAAGKHKYSGIDYDKTVAVAGHDGSQRQVPILNMRDDDGNIVHTDLNAIIVPPKEYADSKVCQKTRDYGSQCGKPFREFTVIFHDEVHAQQAFAELEDENNPLHLIKDGMGINYGVSSMGSLVMSTPKQGKNTGVARNCPECRAEEFFLSSWANGDPALILKYDESGKPVGAMYPDDPSNVHHSYLGDNVRFRNIHAGPKETHVFHLHAHQWVADATDPSSTYLDSQTISPGATFSYDIEFGGSGNRNYTPGDSIFHCHLYPHFAQGMWELWRSHDAFSDGKVGFFDRMKPVSAENDPANMNMPDGEIATGTESPALVPIPGSALAPMPTEAFRGYPFYIPGEAGHRPPQPALDFDVAAPWSGPSVEPPADQVVDGGLPRHVVEADVSEITYVDPAKPDRIIRVRPGEAPAAVPGSTAADNLKLRSDWLATGGEAAQVIAQRVAGQNLVAMTALAARWEKLNIKPLPLTGTDDEKAAMRFHAGQLDGIPGFPRAPTAPFANDEWWHGAAYATDRAATLPDQLAPPSGPAYFYVNGRPPAQGAPFADPCPVDAPERDYRAAFIQTELVYNKHGWFDPQGRIVILENDIKDIIDADKRTSLPAPLFFRANSGECINFKSSNFVPSALNVDDFQVFTPTDTIGQHIHLVKFDVTSSDGSGNGYNYEDATFSPKEVQERVIAFNRQFPLGDSRRLKLRPHPLFMPGGDIYKANIVNPGRYHGLFEKGVCPDQGTTSDDEYEEDLAKNHPYCGAQRTTQRWWADPILSSSIGKNGPRRDNTLRTVFTHDHMGPSSHQQHGLYAGLVIEPANSVWTRIGATSQAADIAAASAATPPNGSGGEYVCDGPTTATGDYIRETDPARNPLCKRLIGGSDLTVPTNPNIVAGSGSVLQVIEPRKPLKLRSDGGPTDTMANIFAPPCAGDSDTNDAVEQPLASGRNRTCPPDLKTGDTRREFDLAIADFGIAYNMALEPINPEPFADNGFRDTSAVRFGRRHVASTLARPLAISSEDPGSQYFNYRHEPVALRISKQTADQVLGGWDYAQNPRRANLNQNCATGDQDCLGDMANAFSTSVHAAQDEQLAKHDIETFPNAATKLWSKGLPDKKLFGKVLASVAQWRRDFNCALYPKSLMPEGDLCRINILRNEGWRQFGDPATPILPAYEGDPVQIRLIQGAQEAQHIFTMNGVRWHRMPGVGSAADGNNSGYTNAQPLGISEHFEFDVKVTPFDAVVSTDLLYFGSSMDQLWDGLWGIMRTFAATEQDGQTLPVRTSAAAKVTFTPSDFIARIPGRVAAQTGTDISSACVRSADGEPLASRYFEVSAVRVCDLYGDCASAHPTGISYNSRLGISDDHGLAYVLESSPQTCRARSSEANIGPVCEELTASWEQRSNTTALASLENAYRVQKRQLTPLVLRAAANQCVIVNLRNLLPPVLRDGPATAPGNAAKAITESSAYLNFVPMITDGFNVNQYRMSSSVGLSPARVTQNVTVNDGTNVGLNDAGRKRSADVNASPFESGPGPLPRQGSLVPPCTGVASVDGEEGAPNQRCMGSYSWSMLDLTKPPGQQGFGSIEFGAVPLRAFGDPIKQPGHGLIGALVVSPPDSAVCAAPQDEQAQQGAGMSARICKDGTYLYTDHVLQIQDAIFATRGGFPVPNLASAEEPDDYGVKGINYKTEPLWARTGNDPAVPFTDRNEQDQTQMMSSLCMDHGKAVPCPADISVVMQCAAGITPRTSGDGRKRCDPETPIIEAAAGEQLRINFVHSGGHTRQQGLAISGHAWNPYPWAQNSERFMADAGSNIRQGVYNGFGPMMGLSLGLVAGGQNPMPFDYLIRSQASFLFDGGIWGLLRVCGPAGGGQPLCAASPPATP